ncbi:MAG TPA: methyltransferase domain-containing protein [Chthoniobacterales bacterium]|nr:methyltransferase domain-containing protein [Chthoniobacterales bacterium]
MKLSHKLTKLVQPLTYRRTWRRVRRVLHPIAMKPLLAKIDGDRLQALRAEYGAPPADAPPGWRHYSKYLDLEKYLRLNIRRVQDLDLHRSPAKDILDIGCGGGFFLFVAQAQGHRGLGLDTGEIPVFDGLVDLLGVERVVYTINAFEPLPDLGRKFDLITAFSTAFHGGREHSWRWGPNEWEFLITDLERHLKPGGQIFFGLNPAYKGEYYTPEILDVFLRFGAKIERENVLFPPKV